MDGDYDRRIIRLVASAATFAPLLWVGNVTLAAPSKPPPLALEWVAPQGCPDDASVIEQVARILGDAPEEPKPIAVRADVWRGEDRRWHATLTSAARSAARTLDAESCEALANATALILALMIDPSRAAPASPPGTQAVVSNPGEQAPPKPPQPMPPHEASLPVLPTPAKTAGAAEGRSSRLAVAVSGGAAVGALQSAQPGAELAVGWLRERLRIELAGTTDWARQHTTIPSRANANEGADFRLLSGLVRGCYALLSSRLVMAGCAVVEIDWIRASGFGANRVFDAAALIPALGAAAHATFAVDSRIALRLVLEGVAPLARPPFVIVGPRPGDSTVVERPGAVWGRALLGAELRFF